MALGPALSTALLNTTREAWRGSNSPDVIVVGAGAAGGLAAMLLTEAGLRVLVLDAGPPHSPRAFGSRRIYDSMIRGLSSPTGARLTRPLIGYRGWRATLNAIARTRQPVQSRCLSWERAPDAFVDDRDCPYLTPANHPFIWLRSRALGGRMLIPGHGRQYYRLGPDDLAPPDGLTPPWPLQLGELDPWYGLVERRLGISGRLDGLSWLPDSELSRLIELTSPQASLQRAINSRWPHARPLPGRFAAPLDCLEAAASTGHLLCRQGAIVREIAVDNSGCASGVIWIDHQSRSEERADAPIIFLCASALESTRILLLSRSPRSPGGLGARSGVLGGCLMDHVILSADGRGPPLAPTLVPEEGGCLYLPRFDSREFPTPRPGRGFGVQVNQFPGNSEWSHFVAVSFGEMLARPRNRVTLDSARRDAWGIPVLRIDCVHGPEEITRARDQHASLKELAEVYGVKLTRIDAEPIPPGLAAHECGTARMGGDPSTSVLDSHNQCWEAQGLYVTDGACFPSQGSQNPTLTILALTARACDHALRAVRVKMN